jgi:hypothetical protein
LKLKKIITISINNVLKKLQITNFEILGISQHGIAILDKNTNKVYKFTESNNEFNIAKKQYKLKTKSLPLIYDIGTIDNINYYVRDLFKPLSDKMMEKLGEEIDDLDEFFYSNIKDVRKSQTNLDYNFDNKFLNFLNNLKKDLKLLGIQNKFDVNGLSLNLYKNNKSDYVLADF